jgi:hypothetical protein
MKLYFNPTSTLHCAFIDGVFGARGERVQFHEARCSVLRTSPPCNARRVPGVLRLFAWRGLIPPEVAAEMRQWEHGGGFSLGAVVRIEATDRKGLEHLGWRRLRREAMQ